MEVSKQSDSITHAAIGKQESVQMGVSNSATLMHVLSTALYTHPMLAAVREIICNGQDGHIIAGCPDQPLLILCTDEILKIRDFGPGIPHEKIGEIYGTYGNSTKTHDGDQTGGFGLGSKAPFAYTDNFEVQNHNGGVKAIYRVLKSSMAAGGSPSIETIMKLPTDQTGIQVSMNIKSPRDAEHLRRFIREVCLLGEIPATLNGEALPVLPLKASPTGYIISNSVGTLLQRINVRYGSVVYPIPRLEAFGDIWDSVSRNVANLWNNANVIFQAQPNTITIAPSREALIFTEGTTETIKGLLASFRPDKAKANAVTSVHVTKHQINKIIPTERLIQPGDLSRDLVLAPIQGTINEFEGGIYNYDARKAAVNFMISRRSLHQRGEKLVHKRLRNAIFHRLVDKHPAEAFLRAGQRHSAFTSGKVRHSNEIRGLTADGILRKALHKHVTWPLMQALKAAGDIVDLSNMHYCFQQYANWDIKLYNPWRMVLGSPENLYGFLRPKILLARSKKAIKDFLNERRLKSPQGNMHGWMVYQLPTSEKHYDAIKKIFVDLGYEVHTYLPVVERVYTERAKPSDDPNWVPAAKKATPKRKGYLTLASAFDGDFFTLTNARTHCRPEQHVTDPIAYVVLSSGSEYSRRRWPTIQDSETCQLINKIFGSRIAVVTTTQVEKIEKTGVPEVSKFIFTYVDDTLAASADFRRFLAFGQHVQTDHGRPKGAEGILQGLTQHKELAANLPGKPFRFCVSPETLSLARTFSDRGFRAFGMPKCDALAQKVKKHKDVDLFKQQINNSPWAKYVDLDAVGGALHRLCPDDGRLAVPYAIVNHLMTPMETQQ